MNIIILYNIIMTLFDQYNFKDYIFESDKNFFKNENIIIKKDNYFKDIQFIFPSYKNNTFHAMMAINNDKNIIANSNSFITDKGFLGNKGYDIATSIYTRLNICYDYLHNNTKVDIIIEEECFFLINCFNAVNFGHDLSIILDRLDYYITKKLDIPIVLPSYLMR